MPRRAVTKRLDLIRQLRAFLRASGPTLDHHLTRRPAAPGDGTLTYRPLFDHLQAELAAVERRLAGAEDAYDLDQARVPRRREERDQAVHALRDRHSSTRRLLRGLRPRRLEAADRSLAAASAAVTGSRCRADQAIAEVDRVAPWIARTLESLCGLAGEHRLADRVRGR